MHEDLVAENILIKDALKMEDQQRYAYGQSARPTVGHHQRSSSGDYLIAGGARYNPHQ